MIEEGGIEVVGGGGMPPPPEFENEKRRGEISQIKMFNQN